MNQNINAIIITIAIMISQLFKCFEEEEINGLGVVVCPIAVLEGGSRVEFGVTVDSCGPANELGVVDEDSVDVHRWPHLNLLTIAIVCRRHSASFA
jgi:hypothetical protein